MCYCYCCCSTIGKGSPTSVVTSQETFLSHRNLQLVLRFLLNAVHDAICVSRNFLCSLLIPIFGPPVATDISQTEELFAYKMQNDSMWMSALKLLNRVRRQQETQKRPKGMTTQRKGNTTTQPRTRE